MTASVYVLILATQYELQSDLQMFATCAELGGAQHRPYLKLGLAANSSRSEVT